MWVNGRCLNPAVMTYDSLISISSMSGLVQFYPNKVKANTPSAPIMISSVWVDSTNLSHLNEQIILNPDFRELRIKISSPYYGHPENLDMEFKLIGYSDTWQKLNKNHEITFQNLKYGTYTLQIRKKAGFGSNNVSHKSLIINVSPYFYQQWWFYLLMLSLLIACMILFSSMYNRVILKQKAKLSRLVDDRTLELKEINKELIETNEQNNLLLSVLIHDIKAPMKMVENVTEDMRDIWHKISEPEKQKIILDISNTTKKINQFMFQFIGYIKAQKNETLNYEVCKLKYLIDDVISFHEQHEKLKSSSIQLSNAVPETVTFSTEVVLLKIIINNLIDNSIKFSEHGHIILEAEQDKNFTYINCTDNGKGMSQETIEQILSPEYKANSIRTDSYRLGYAFIKNFVKKLNGELNIISSLDKGTTVSIKLPNTW